MSKVRHVLSELVRRQVLRTLGAYIVIIWGLAQGLAGLSPSFGIPDWVTRLFIYTAIGATPLVAWLAWRYQFTMQGVVRDPEDEEAALDGTGLLNRARSRHDSLGVSAIIVSWQSENEELQMVESTEPIVIGRDTGCDVVIMNPSREPQSCSDLGSQQCLVCHRPPECQWHLAGWRSHRGRRTQRPGHVVARSRRSPAENQRPGHRHDGRIRYRTVNTQLLKASASHRNHCAFGYPRHPNSFR